MAKKSAVGVVGLGAIGMGTALSLINAGIETYGCDLRQDALDRLSESGGHAVSSLDALGAAASTVMLFVVNAQQAEAVLFGDGGAADSLAEGSIVVSCVTMSPQEAIGIGERLASRGIDMVDAPTSGGAARAEQGKTTYIVSGDPKHVDAVSFALEATSERIFRVGDAIGQGATVKTVHQLLAGVHIATAMEAMALGIKMGVDPDSLYEVVCGCAGNSWMFENRVPHVLAGDYTPLSAVDIFVKDLGLVLDAGKQARFPLPVASTAYQQFVAASAAGYGGQDDSAVIKIYRDLAGFKLPGD
ncbi:MAG: NAD-binding protein [Alphaproteobacteria bacterium]|nr:NAD-binding protein [Alphaproteobacteria bacterium]